MFSSLIRHSIFRAIALGPVSVQVTIEADEAYLFVLKPGVTIYVGRQREHALGPLIEKQVPWGSYQIQTSASITHEMGFVSLHARPNADGSMVVHPSTASQIYPLAAVPMMPGVGVRDTVMLTYGGDEGEVEYVLIEEVHYVPADAIGI
ncbi:hypothetical protein [Spirosoma endbachense]|uniref:Uncharacterized protein n=1 Tax=Spirosoma endbachense TaxID=2666025 RepID=A0A6P1VWI4_9BACT|nr:hypothetical protein [Spirosoma endbachense]QHV97571.1 hypothetical protein GJR95_22305 [Spirosoma endbachense]